MSVHSTGKIKICFYIDSLYLGGAQRVMSNLVNYFAADQSVEVVFITDFPNRSGQEEYALSPGIKRRYLSSKIGHNYIGKLIINLVRIKELRKILKLEKPQSVLSFLGRPNYRMLLASVRLPIRKIVSVRNDPNKEYGGSRWEKKLANTMFYWADGCVFQTKGASDYFSETIKRKSVVIGNPVDQKFFHRTWKENSKDIIAVGRLQVQKNHKLLIRAFADVAEKFPEHSLKIYGDGELKTELQNLIVSLGLENRIFLMGKNMNIQDVLPEARLFVLTSDYEGLPNSLMEAMAVGVPCISTDCSCGGPKELLSDGAGILTKCGDKEALVNALTTVLSDIELSKKLGKAAKAKAEEYRENNIMRYWEKYLRGMAL